MDGPRPWRFEAIGTHWSVSSASPLVPELRRAVRRRVEAFDAVYSRFRPDSLVTRLAGAVEGGSFSFPSVDLVLFDLYDRLVETTDGAVDPLVGARLDVLGYGPDYRLRPGPTARQAFHPGERPRWGIDARHVGGVLTTRGPVVLDVGAVGKGYLVDRVTELLRAAGSNEFTVDAGGDLRRHGPAVRVGLEDPRDHARVVGVVEVGTDRGTSALCASATDRRRWGPGLHHVLDARTGLPTTGVDAAWGVAGDAATADALATAAFFVAPDRAVAALGGSAARMLTGRRLERDAGWPGNFFTAPPTHDTTGENHDG